MYKVISFLDNQIGLIEQTLNENKDYHIVHVWSVNSRLVVIMEKNSKVGRPRKEENNEE